MTMRLIWICFALLTGVSLMFTGAVGGGTANGNVDNDRTQRRLLNIVNTIDETISKMADLVNATDFNRTTDVIRKFPIPGRGSNSSSERAADAEETDATDSNKTTELIRDFPIPIRRSNSSSETASDSEETASQGGETALEKSPSTVQDDSEDENTKQNSESTNVEESSDSEGSATQGSNAATTEETTDGDGSDSPKESQSTNVKETSDSDGSATQDANSTTTEETTDGDGSDSPKQSEKTSGDVADEESSTDVDRVLVAAWLFILFMCVIACVWLAGQALCCRGTEKADESKETTSTTRTVPYV